MEKEELAHLLQIAQEYGLERDYIMFLTLSYTGMRVGELCALKWSDIDFKEQTRTQQLYQETYYNKDFVFAQQDKKKLGYPLYRRLLGVRMARLLKLSGLNTNLSPHSLRHTHTSLLSEAGTSLEQIMHRLGHSNDSTTKNIYLHVAKPKRKEASHKFAELMRSF